MFYSRAALVGCLGLFAMSGCGWQDYEDFDYNGVHSDDGIGFATIKRYYEGRDEVTHIARRNNSTQLYTGELSDLDGAKALTGVLNGEAIAVYYMRSAGYSILIRAEEEVSSADEKTRLMYVDTIDMSGNVTNIITQTVRSRIPA